MYICKVKKIEIHSSLKKKIYIALASLFVVLGAIGTIIPLLPTTPFLLVAVYFYMKSSKKRVRSLLNNKILGPYIYSYLSKEGMPISVKLKTLTILWATLILSGIYATESLHVRLLLVGVGIAVTLHIILKKTRKAINQKL